LLSGGGILKTLNQFNWLRNLFLKARYTYLVKFWGMDISPTAKFSLTAKFDKTFPSGIHLGHKSYVAFGATILTHDMVRGLYLHTRVGRQCFIGANSLILPGVTVGDESIVAAGSVVTKDVPPNTIVAGNPARVIKENIEVIGYGRLKSAADTEAKCRTENNFYKQD
jgi:acetyltransferase-like isoleucine patch superfamily enzyme